MVCNNCKNEISDTALYCPICGTAVKAAEIPQPASQEQGYQEQIPSQIPEQQQVQANVQQEIPQENIPQSEQPIPNQQDYQQGYQQIPPQQGYQQGYQQVPPQQGYQQGYQQVPPQQGYQQGQQQVPPQQGYQQGYQQVPPYGYGQPQPAKQSNVVSALAYIPILFWLPLVAEKGNQLGRQTSNQGLLLLIFGGGINLILGIITGILSSVLYNTWDYSLYRILPIFITIVGLLSWAVSILVLVCIIIGIVKAAKGQVFRIPLIGKINIIK
ncbi:MAG: hypothetical protein DBX37_00675 [Massilioclostridium sp.]|nr:MAG: hypothetical protein DBX37_00675 [Massilioclostridium sp.]